ncbi:MAG: hypothetical protein UZ22_OP11002000375 [Microgenomates bacterium OLB23]|nr:MAG: hypothetical protein UZ22_OP11002000375 [Microgenomates bacterium OLB23]
MKKASIKKIIFAFFALILALGMPVLNRNLISDKVKVNIPPTYTELWEFMSTQPKGTLLTLPIHTFSGWQYYDWGYQGSGFIWFPLKQPVLDRDSDRWNNLNEEAFRELQYTLYRKDPKKICCHSRKI